MCRFCAFASSTGQQNRGRTRPPAWQTFATPEPLSRTRTRSFCCTGPGMYEPGEVKPWEAQTLTAIVAKNRHGSTGKLNFDFYGSSGIIRERRLQTGGGL